MLEVEFRIRYLLNDGECYDSCELCVVCVRSALVLLEEDTFDARSRWRGT